MLPPLFFSILNSLFVPLLATVSVPVDSVPSSPPVACRHGVRRWSGARWSTGPSWLAEGKELSALGPASGWACAAAWFPMLSNTACDRSLCSC